MVHIYTVVCYKMSYIPSLMKRNGDETKEGNGKDNMKISPLELSYYTTGWIRTISLYAESKKNLNANQKTKVLTTNLVIGNAHKQT